MKQIFHPYTDWECFKAGFYNESFKDLDELQCKTLYSKFLSNDTLFEAALNRVIKEWTNSCEHFLTKPSINKIAWLGQASCCISEGLPSKYRGGFYLLSKYDQDKADKLAERYYKIWKLKYESTSKNGKNKDIQMTSRIVHHRSYLIRTSYPHTRPSLALF